MAKPEIIFVRSLPEMLRRVFCERLDTGEWFDALHAVYMEGSERFEEVVIAAEEALIGESTDATE